MSSSSAATPQRSHRRIVTLARHAAKCGFCNHPCRAAIEFDFLTWRNPFDLNFILRRSVFRSTKSENIAQIKRAKGRNL